MNAVEIRFLQPSEASVLTTLIEEAYGDTYDAEWVYQPEEIARRIESGRLVSTIGVVGTTVAGHVALSREGSQSPVMHSGIAVVTEQARGQHLFTRLKNQAATWAQGQGVYGIFSEATAAHPYSQKANLELGAHETGFLLGWIPATVTNNAAVTPANSSHRQSVALFYLQTNEAHDHPVFAPKKYRDVIASIVETSGLRGRLTAAPTQFSVPTRTEFEILEKDDHNLSIISVSKVGADLARVVEENSAKLFQNRGRDVVYLDLPLNQPATETVLEGELESLAFSFAGIFPNQQRDEDVLRLQSLPEVEIRTEDIATASTHGIELLNYVLQDLQAMQRN